MKITYIKHSAFCVEWERCVWIFDYWTGVIPKFPADKEVIWFVSHKHGDHFNPGIFKISAKYPKVSYILSDDLRYPVKKLNLSEDVQAAITYLKPDNVHKRDQMVVRTLRSTDCGVAFLIEYAGKTIYHAGDLNWWVWKEESKQEYNDMTARFQREMAKLTEMAQHIDVAFVPLDPRQEEWYRLGMDYFLEHVDVDLVYPMHFWEQFHVVERYRQSLGEERKKVAELLDIVDIGGNPTGEVCDRVQIHREGLLHRTSHVWIARKNQKSGMDLLLQKRSDDKDSHPGCYDISSAGHIPAGCGYLESALRELEEELSVQAAKEELQDCGQRYVHWDEEFYGEMFRDRQVSRVYLLWKELDISALKLQHLEVSKVCWMDYKECVKAVKEGTIPNCIALEELEMIKKTAMRPDA